MTTFLSLLPAVLEAHRVLQTQMLPLVVSLKNTSLPLNDRWDAYVALVKNNVLVSEGIGDGYIENLGPNVTMYDDFSTDRYVAITFPEMYQIIRDKIEEGEDFGGDGFSVDNIPKWQEAVLASGLSGFTYDW